MGSGYHDLLHWIAVAIGYRVGDDLPFWMHPVLHLVLIWAPLALLALAVIRAAAWLRRKRLAARNADNWLTRPTVSGFSPGVYRFVLRHSRAQQLGLVALGLAGMPLLYATLELPKVIINNAIDAGNFPVTLMGATLEQVGYLFLLCALYLAAILAHGSLKFSLNIWKGRVGERLLRRLRLSVYRRWRNGAGTVRRGEVIPLLVQEVEPIGGFASDAFALPVFQGGTFVTILAFMFMQDPVLGAAAVTLLPVQLAVLPRLQRRMNRLARSRVAEVRGLGGELSDQAATERSIGSLLAVGSSFRRIESIRRDIHRTKFFMKALTNFLTALTPFFFYSIGGYLVIEGRLSLGALVAVLAAYKDFSAPLRELFRYYQAAEDVRIRYGEVLGFLGAGTAARTGPDEHLVSVARNRGLTTVAQ